MTEVVRSFTVATINKDTVQCTWTGLDGDDSGMAVDLSGYPDKTVHIYGTFDSATCSLYGSNDPLVLVDRAAGTLFGSKTASWIAIVDPQGNAIAKSAAGMEAILENPRYILPVNTGGGASTSLKVVITASRSRI